MMLETTVVRTVGDIYQAIGFSDDDKMGGDSVIMCKYASGVSSVEVGSNTGKVYQPLSDRTKSLSQISISTNGTIFRCSFNRDINSTDPEIFSLERSWNLLYARGIVAGGSPQHHNFRRASPSQVDFLTASLITAEDTDKTMIKVHGSLMIIAWIFFSSIGIVTARHYKAEWPDDSINKQKVWFQVHRACMILVFLCTAASFVVIFLEVEGYREIVVTDGRKYLESHPILGIVVTCLTCINPIMSLFRCAPDDKKRPIFNVAHFIVGSAAHILSAITITFGMNLEHAGVPEEATYVMYGYVATFILIEIILEVWRIAGAKQKDIDDSVQMNDISSVSQDSTPNKSLYKRKSRKPLVLYFHTVAMMVYAITMIVLVFQDNSET
ncbi:hypothetical protein FSP39_015973 [Pinctada imbricata]|uniref:Ferric-chelate reductase 1 n=1 Tax=Pinctada imbricata TaxID=66713 RepID=A0AA89C7J5_PINIB|nr:hypothetical protein FSP39_015973 [Pinctada imbricata]